MLSSAASARLPRSAMSLSRLSTPFKSASSAAAAAASSSRSTSSAQPFSAGSTRSAITVIRAVPDAPLALSLFAIASKSASVFLKAASANSGAPDFALVTLLFMVFAKSSSFGKKTPLNLS